MTTMCLKRSERISPFVVSLDVESSVYLHSLEIEPNPRASTRLLSRERTGASAVWSDLISFDADTREARIGVKWVTTGSAAPGRRYKATLSILDEAGVLAPAKPGYSNPIVIKGRIGPAADPTDERRVNIVIA
jgi:hypothetical protein